MVDLVIIAPDTKTLVFQSEIRVTESGEERVTESGELRVVEG